MGDTDPKKTPIEKQSVENAACEGPKRSIDFLKGSKPSENVSIEETVAVTGPEFRESHTGKERDSIAGVKVETVFENPESTVSSTEKINRTQNNDEKDKKSGHSEDAQDEGASSAADSPVAKKSSIKSDCTMQQQAHKDKMAESKNRSDIFALNNSYNTNSTPIIFSVTGVPSRKNYPKRGAVNSAMLSSTEQPEAGGGGGGGRPASECSDTLKTPSDSPSKTSQSRNPVTGTGVDSRDEYKNYKPHQRRKDGNPLLGLGYDDAPVNTGPRIPPGGYSKGLW